MLILYRIINRSNIYTINSLEFVSEHDLKSFNIWISSQKDLCLGSCLKNSTISDYHEFQKLGYILIWKEILSGLSKSKYLLIEIRNIYPSRNDEILSIIRDFKLSKLL